MNISLDSSKNDLSNTTTIVILKDYKLVDYDISPRKIKRKRSFTPPPHLSSDSKLISKRYKFDDKIILLNDTEKIVNY